MTAEARRVLVIDDDEMVATTFTHMLQLDGFEVRSATTAAQGLAEAVDWQPAAIILDFRMPLMDGLGFLRALRQRAHGRRVPVAIVTGDYLIDDDVIDAAVNLGATVKFKPLWVDDLITLTYALLTQSQSAAPNSTVAACCASDVGLGAMR